MKDKKYLIIDDAIRAVNEGRPVPFRIREFKLKWIAEGYRGYYMVYATAISGWEKLESDWITGDWSDAGDHASSTVEARLDKLAEKMENEGREMVVVFTPTSNVFSTSFDVFTREKIIN